MVQLLISSRTTYIILMRMCAYVFNIVIQIKCGESRLWSLRCPEKSDIYSWKVNDKFSVNMKNTYFAIFITIEAVVVYIEIHTNGNKVSNWSHFRSKVGSFDM
jgi:hypothetical protein